MQFISNLLGGNSNDAASATTSGQSLVGTASDPLFMDGTKTPGGTATTVGDALQGEPKPKLLMFYFSMHNCPPCREFTPLLAELYSEMNETSKQFEVVFFSGDQDESVYREYLVEMPWLALPFKDGRMKPAAKHFGVRGLPRCVLFNARTYLVVHEDAVQTVSEQGPVILEQWLSQA